MRHLGIGKMSKGLAVLFLCGCCWVSALATRRDTYLTAYMESHGPSSLPPGEVFAAEGQGGSYGPPAVGYSYGPPKDSYGPPKDSYGPAMAEPHAAPDNPLDPIHAKVVLLFKILLKLLLFKLFVKFVAIICVMFFLPTLSGLGLAKEAAEDTMMSSRKGDEDKLQLTQFVLDAINGTPVVCREDSPLCRLRRAIQEVDHHNSVPRLFSLYMKEEQEKSRHNSKS